MIMIRAVGAWVRAGRGGVVVARVAGVAGWVSIASRRSGMGCWRWGVVGRGRHLCVELEVVDDYVDRYEGGQLEGHVEEQVHHVRLVGEHGAHGRHHGLGGAPLQLGHRPLLDLLRVRVCVRDRVGVRVRVRPALLTLASVMQTASAMAAAKKVPCICTWNWMSSGAMK